MRSVDVLFGVVQIRGLGSVRVWSQLVGGGSLGGVGLGFLGVGWLARAIVRIYQYPCRSQRYVFSGLGFLPSVSPLLCFWLLVWRTFAL